MSHRRLHSYLMAQETPILPSKYTPHFVTSSFNYCVRFLLI